MSNNRNRILALLKVLYEKTDENNSLRMSEITALLEQQGYKCDRRTFYEDKAALIAAGFNIQGERKYHIASRIIDFATVKFLVDYIAVSETLSVQQSYEMKDALLSLLSEHQAELINDQFNINKNIKSQNNDNLFSNIEQITYAIHNQKRIEFKYKNRLYLFSPYSFVSSNQRYYIVGYNHRANKIFHLKVEKITDLDVTKYQSAPINEISDDEYFDIAEYMMKTFNMYSGEQTKVKLRFNQNILDEMKKHFKNVKVISNSKSKKDKVIEAEVEASISDGFVSFVLSMRDNIQIIEPEFVVNKIKEQAQNILNMYN